MRTLLRTAIFAAILAAWSPAAAEVVLVESYTGRRPEHADELLRPMLQELNRLGVISGQALTDALDGSSRPGIAIPRAQLNYLDSLVDSGYTLLTNGEYKTAAERLSRAVELAHSAPALLAKDESLRDSTLRALLGLTMALRREGDQAMAKRKKADAAESRKLADAVLEEAIRSFPSNDPDPGEYGTELLQWWRKARDRLLSRGAGALVVDPGDDGVTIWINEAFAGVGQTTKTDLPPGRYRVYAQRADVIGRVYTVDVQPHDVARLTIDWSFDAALHTRPWVGFSFASPSDHRDQRANYAARLAKATPRATEAIIVGLSSTSDSQVAFGLLVDLDGRAVVSGQVMLGRADSSKHLRRLARLLAGGEERGRDVDGVERLDGDPMPWVDRPAVPLVATAPQTEGGRPVPRWVSWSAIGAGTAAVLAGGVFVWLDDRCPGRPFTELPECPTVYETAPTGWAMLAGGGLVIGGAATYLFVHRNDADDHRTPLISIRPTRGGGEVSVSLPF